MTSLLFKRGETPLKLDVEYNNDNVYISGAYIDSSIELKMDKQQFFKIMEMDVNEILPLDYVLCHLIQQTGQSPSPYIQEKYRAEFGKIVKDTIVKIRDIYKSIKE